MIELVVLVLVAVELILRFFLLVDILSIASDE